MENIDIRDNIKTLRTKHLGITQSEFANKISIARNTLTLVENKKRNISDKVINDICREFKVREEWLRNGKGEIFNKVDEEEEIIRWIGNLLNPNTDTDKFVLKVAHKMSQIPPEQWNAIRDFLKDLVEED